MSARSPGPGPTRCPRASRSRRRSGSRSPATLPAAAAGGDPGRVRVAIGDESGRLPAIGLGVPAEEAEHALAAGDAARASRPALARLRGRPSPRPRPAGARAATAPSPTLTGAEIVLEIITRGSLDPAAELAALAASAAEAGLAPAAVVGLPGAGHEVGAARRALAGDAELRGDLRRGARRVSRPRSSAAAWRPTSPSSTASARPPRPLDYVTHTTCPTVHAADDRSVMETIEALPYQILSTRAFMGDGFPTASARARSAAARTPTARPPRRTPTTAASASATIDPRQRGLFNAAWTLAYVAACARGGIEAVALGAPTGPFGHIYRRTDFAQPYFDGLDGPAVYPAFHVVAGLAALDGAAVLATECHPRRRGRGPRRPRRRQDGPLARQPDRRRRRPSSFPPTWRERASSRSTPMPSRS